MKQKSYKKFLSLVASTFLLLSCSEIEQEAESSVAKTSAQIAAASQQFYETEARRPSGVQVQSQSFVGPERQLVAPVERLPNSLRSRTDISLVSRAPLTLSQIAVRLNEITGVPVLVKLGQTGSLVQVADNSNSGDDPDVGQPPAVEALVQADTRTTSLQIRPNLKGSLGSVLDQLSAAFEVEWDYIEGGIVFRDFVTRRYQITLLPSEMSTSFNAGPLSRTTAFNFWSEVEQAIDALVADDARVSYGTSTGIVTVTARLSDHHTIRKYLSELNEQLGQQVAFDINVLSVVLEDKSDLSVSLNAALAEQNIVGEFVSDPVAVTGGGSFNVGVTSGSVNVSAVVQSLARRGRVAIETRAGGITTNFQPVPISVTETIAYVSSTESNFDDSGNLVGTELTTDTIEVGFVLLVLPRILNSREVLLNYSISLSTNNGFQQFGEVQLPNTSKQVLDQQAILRNGQSLVIAGFEEKQTEVGRQGVGNANFLGLGGRRNAAVDRESTVIIITPRLLTRNSGQ
jgi:type II secretory pathway component GspD/PulD (secretin)